MHTPAGQLRGGPASGELGAGTAAVLKVVLMPACWCCCRAVSRCLHRGACLLALLINAIKPPLPLPPLPQVMESWKMILGAGRLRIKLEDVRVFASDRWAVAGWGSGCLATEEGAPCRPCGAYASQGTVLTLPSYLALPAPCCSSAFVTCVEVTESGEGRGRCVWPKHSRAVEWCSTAVHSGGRSAVACSTTCNQHLARPLLSKGSVLLLHLSCRIAATNVFEKQGGAWKLVHHHGSPAPR